MEAGPFEMDCSGETVLRKAELQGEKLEDEYRVKVEMEAGPFEMDCSGETVLRKAELQGES